MNETCAACCEKNPKPEGRMILSSDVSYPWYKPAKPVTRGGSKSKIDLIFLKSHVSYHLVFLKQKHKKTGRSLKMGLSQNANILY